MYNKEVQPEGKWRRENESMHLFIYRRGRWVGGTHPLTQVLR